MPYGDRGRRARCTASVRDTMLVVGTAVLPALASGVIRRPPRLMGRVARWDADARAIAVLQRLRARYGPQPVRLRVPGRSMAMVLDPGDVGRLLAASPEPFSPATREKVAALAHFQPHGVLVGTRADRARRRALDERALDTHQPVHAAAASLTRTVREETEDLRTEIARTGELTWDRFATSWWRVVRRVVLGDAARDDRELTDLLGRLRSAANWSLLAPRRKKVRAELTRRLRSIVDSAEPGSLAHRARQAGGVDDADQVPHWLFAFDAAGMVTLRTLALLATHPERAERALIEIQQTDRERPHGLPYLRACLLDTARLWPTTPMVLRESTAPTEWGRCVFPAATTFVVYTPLFHRDTTQLPYANRFAPDIWLDGRASASPALVPFSAGPADCPGRNVVLLIASTLLAELLRGLDFRLVRPPDLNPHAPLPAAIDDFALVLTGQARTGRVPQPAPAAHRLANPYPL